MFRYGSMLFITFYNATLWEIFKKTHWFWAGFRSWTMDSARYTMQSSDSHYKTLQYTAVQTTSRIPSSQEPSDFLTPLIMHKIRVASYVSIIARHIHNGNRKWMDGWIYTTGSDLQCHMFVYLTVTAFGCHRYVSSIFFILFLL